MKVNATTATWAHLNYTNAMERLASTADPYIGPISLDHVQLCPQNAGFNSKEQILELAALYPKTKFRLHADVKVVGRFTKADLCWFNDDDIKNWSCIANISNALNAPCYSLHAGERKGCSLDKLFEKYYRLQELFDAPVAIEGHYPASNDMWLLSNWDEYRLLFETDINYVVDLSHFNIIAKRYGWDDDLIIALITSPKCLEIHVSANNGNADSHEPINSEPIWWKYLQNSTADIFYEGNHSIIEWRANNPEFFKRK